VNIAVRYYSKGGNTKKIAEAIASAAGTSALDCSEGLTGPVDILFLGAAIYAFELDDAVKSFIAELKPGDVKAAAVFGTSAIAKNGNRAMIKLLAAKGIAVRERDFYCRGGYKFMHKGRPNAEDIAQAAEFAKAVLSE
jgi:flavodoxin